MIEVTDTIAIPESEISFVFIRASGPGGQNVNKVSTAVQMRFDVINCSALDDLVKHRLLKIAGKKINSEGVLVLTVRKHRTQARNRNAAIERLIDLVQEAAHSPKRRIPTRPSKSSTEQRLRNKRLKSELKKTRQGKKWLDE